MPNQPVLGRRPLLAGAAAAGAAALTAGPAGAGAGLWRDTLSALVGDAATVAAAPLVRAYLAQVPDAPDRLRALAGRLAAAPDVWGLGAWLATARREDFAAGDVLVLKGWVLARSEAEILALAALA